MYTIEACWYVRDGKMAEARAALKALAAAVEAGEPGTLGYLIHEAAPGSLPPAPDGEIVFVEIYRDKAAFLAHVNGPIFTGFVKDHADLFVADFGAPPSPYMQTTTLDRITGFLRAAAS